MSSSRTANPPAPEFLDLKGLSAYSSLSVKTLRRVLASPGGPPSYCPGGKVLVRLAEFEAWLARHRRVPDDQGDRVDQILAEFRGGR
jgi:hypothetical protein